MHSHLILYRHYVVNADALEMMLFDVPAWGEATDRLSIKGNAALDRLECDSRAEVRSYGKSASNNSKGML